MRKLGIDKLKVKHLPDYPLSIDPSQQPEDTATQKPLYCYNWKLSADDKANSKNLVEIQQWVMLNAPVEIPSVIGMLQLVLPKDLKHQICVIFQHMARQYCLKLQKDEALASRENEDDRDLSDTQEENLVSMSVSKAHKDSRAQSKFDAVFILNAMSDDEVNPDYRPMSDEVRIFISRAPDYRSEILQTIYDDPEKIINNYPPPSTKFLKHRLHAWQIKPELLALAEYSNNLGSSRLAYSGTAWGDKKDPIDDGLNGVVHHKQK
ncbi:hypothetical protein SERLA73DRAFT_151934 [Serpula lacrymans var. lacrymans S7.3]|uniref:Uncharacterized protein n=2 Tax=Serpula lacrymans var. lacrymans TaxID=341189 RepID=F8PUD5_SERL3|nr:uncharacterized protein SERLADRAFT_436977 [Serpula lacrymans var. lacrymans S7.9]EGN99655.1 hypothetical protein SERLA73DRAFT_151934 [Serpula lacrymans var. lacrymans S7.3]EGO25218.1 hypothetical protein SERLADRAFT_436977 [Serpula lacrymans var. lacrymans S7.9]